MTFELEDRAGTLVAHVHDELTGDAAEPFVAEIMTRLSVRGARAVLDLSDVPFMNSTGLSELVRIVSQANVQEARVVLAQLSPFVAGVLSTTQLVRFFEIYDDVETALAALG